MRSAHWGCALHNQPKAPTAGLRKPSKATTSRHPPRVRLQLDGIDPASNQKTTLSMRTTPGTTSSSVDLSVGTTAGSPGRS